MLASPVDNNAGGSCRGKQNYNQQCSLPHQKSECSVPNVREPILADLQISFDEKPETDFCKDDTCTESNDIEATGCSRVAKNDTCSTESYDREATGCSRIAKNGVCGARPREESRATKEPTRADVSRNDLKNSSCRQPTFDDEQQKGAGASRRNNEPWTGCESLLQVSTTTEADFCKNDTCTESNDREATGCSRTAKNGACGARPCEESRAAKEPTRADVSRDDLKKISCCRQPTFNDEQQKGAGSSRWNNEPWMGCESLLQVSTTTEADFCKNDTCTESNDREATGCSRIAKNDTCSTESNEREATGCSRTAKNGACGARPREENRAAKEPTRADVSRDDLKKTSCCRQPTFDDEQQKGKGSSRQNNGPWTGRESLLQASTPTVRPTKDPTTDQKSAPPPTSNNRTLTNLTVTNRSDGILQEFEKELYKVEQRRAQLMRCIERKQRALMKDNREMRTSLQNYCEQQSSGGEKQSLHDTRDHRPPQQDTRERRPSQYDTSKLQSSQHNTSERRPSQYDTRVHRPSQHDTNERRLSQYEIRERRSSRHETRKRRTSHDDTRKRRPSQDEIRKRRPSQDDTRKRRLSQHDTRKRRPSQDDTRNRRPSQDDTRNRRPSQDDTRNRRTSQDDTRKRRSFWNDTRERRPSQHDSRERRSSQYDLREGQPSMLDARGRQSSKGESKNRKQPQGSFVFECFCNFIRKDNSFNIEPATKQVQRDESYQPSARGVSDRNSFCPIQVSRHNNNNAYNTTEVEVARKDAPLTRRHGGSGRRNTPRNDATATSPDSSEQNLSRQDTFQPRGCPRLRVVDLISFTNKSSDTTVGGTQKHNNRGCRNETQ